jgi:hypothetical protein
MKVKFYQSGEKGACEESHRGSLESGCERGRRSGAEDSGGELYRPCTANCLPEAWPHVPETFDVVFAKLNTLAA